ncbi:MAG: glycoside hydrolase [Bacteroidota bacterium]|nr:glycoside hydrolase [Bacteroidota bacterium]
MIIYFMKGLRMGNSTFLLLTTLFLACTFSNKSALGQGPKKISQFESAGLCDLLIDNTGNYHVVFQERPGNGKPVFIYYSNSANKGVTWSKPVNLSIDNTGNGAGYPRILQDGTGNIYAIWKRFGNSKADYPERDPILEGPGGYTMGTIYYKVLTGGTWSQQQQINETEQTQNAWFATVTPQGKVAVFWLQLGADAIKYKFSGEVYCDYLRVASLNGSSHSAIVDLNKPASVAPGAYSSTLLQQGGRNLQGYVDNANLPHLLYADWKDNMQQLLYFDGKAERVVYKYPKYGTYNTFNYPAKLLLDDKGVDHAFLLPDATTLESEQLWDINLATNQRTPLVSIDEKGKKIYDFQASQGPRGSMAITIDVGGAAGGNTEALGAFYEKGKWSKMMLTNNASKEKFFYKEFDNSPYYGRTYIASLTKYNSQFSSVAWDQAGKKSMIMTLSAYWSSGGLSTASPSIIFLPIDK